MANLIYRELNRSEFDKIPSEATNGLELPKSNCRVVAAVDDGGVVVGMWAALGVVHLEPIWVREDHRKSPTVLRRMWSKLKSLLQEDGVRSTLTVIDEDNVPATKRIAEWCGGRPLPGRLYFLDIGDK